MVVAQEARLLTHSNEHARVVFVQIARDELVAQRVQSVPGLSVASLQEQLVSRLQQGRCYTHKIFYLYCTCTYYENRGRG